jgi:hypothetical protein
LSRDTGYRLMRKILRSRITVFLFRRLHTYQPQVQSPR